MRQVRNAGDGFEDTGLLNSGPHCTDSVPPFVNDRFIASTTPFVLLARRKLKVKDWQDMLT